MSLMAAPPTELVNVLDEKQLRGTFGAFPTGVTVVTVGGDAPRGMTANSFTSVSLAPPLVLFCVNKDAVMHRSLDQSSTFSVSVLGAGQEVVARHFANRSRPAGAGQFESVDWTPGRVGDAPLIDPDAGEAADAAGAQLGSNPPPADSPGTDTGAPLGGGGGARCDPAPPEESPDALWVYQAGGV